MVSWCHGVMVSTFNFQYYEAKRFSNEVFPGEFAARSGEGVAPMD